MVSQVETEFFSKYLKKFYYICGIKLQKNGSDMQYAFKNFFKSNSVCSNRSIFRGRENRDNYGQKSNFGR